MGRSPGDKPQTLTRYHSYGLPQLYEVRLLPDLQLKGHKGENFLFFLFSFVRVR